MKLSEITLKTIYHVRDIGGDTCTFFVDVATRKYIGKYIDGTGFVSRNFGDGGRYDYTPITTKELKWVEKCIEREQYEPFEEFIYSETYEIY